MDPRIILRRLIGRLEPKVGHIRPEDFSRWEGEDAPASPENGELHLAEALIEAKEALASRDPGKMIEAALVLPTFERQGHELRAKEIKRAGGKTTGAKQAAAAEVRYAPHVKRFRFLLGQGKQPGTARRIIAREMSKAGIEPPSDRTLTKWLK